MRVRLLAARLDVSGRGHVAADGRVADDTGAPTHAGTHQESVLLREVFEDFCKVRVQAFGDQASGAIEQLGEGSSFEGQYAEVGFIAAQDYNLYAVSIDSGRVLWRFSDGTLFSHLRTSGRKSSRNDRTMR